MKKKVFDIWRSLTGIWIVENTIDNKNIFHFRAAVRTRKLAEDLAKHMEKYLS